MMRVLFVDDEQLVLDGLRDVLRRQRKRWDMQFAVEARVALQWMEQQPFDVIVTDMRMPGMDGAALLAQVKKHYPATARVVLSGQADRESVLRALPAAHQFLSKPCDPELLVQVIERVSQLQSKLADPKIRSIVGGIDHLPSAPSMYWDLTMAAAKPETDINDLAAIVEKDPAMSLKVLQLVNSAYFGAARRVTSVQQAVARLGVELLKALTLTVHAFDTLKAPPCEGFSIDELQEHSLTTARLAKQLCLDATSSSEAFAAAMLHDVGKLVLAVGAPGRLREVLEEQQKSKRPFFVVELERFGITHAEIGAYLLGSWGLPLTMVEAVAYHHTPSAAPESCIPVIAALHVADAFTDTAEYRACLPGYDQKIDLAFLAQANLSAELPRWRELAAKLASG
jgi:putative nucleotidyltransferase with HDIG domain